MRDAEIVQGAFTQRQFTNSRIGDIPTETAPCQRSLARSELLGNKLYLSFDKHSVYGGRSGFDYRQGYFPANKAEEE
jgi:hypothetical protein